MKTDRRGFTLIEMIGVLAVISILAALVAPKIFQVIADSKTTRMAAETQTYSTAVANWYKDVGTLSPLTAAGLPGVNSTTFHQQLTGLSGTWPPAGNPGRWANWRGPYVDSVLNFPIGSALSIYNYLGTAGAANAASNTIFDLNDDGQSDVTGARVVFLYVTGVPVTEFERVDSVLDSGLTVAARQAQGRVKWVAAGGGAMRIYMAHN